MLARGEEAKDGKETTSHQEARQIGKTKLSRLVKDKESARNQCNEINGGVGQRIRDAVEKDNLDPVAFSIACRLNRMTPQKLYGTLPALLYYVEVLGLEEKAKQAPPLALPEGAEAEEE